MAYNKFIFKDGEVALDLTSDTITPDKLKEGVTAHDRSGNAIVGTAVEPSGEIAITENGSVDVAQYATANVQVEPTLQDKTITVNGAITADEGYDGLGTVTVAVPDTIPDLQDKTATITANGTTTITSDAGYDGLNSVSVTVNVPAPTHEVYAGEYEEIGGLINFTIDGVTYQAEQGMTWEEWCQSEYCTDDTIKQSSDVVYAPSGNFLFERDGCTMADYGSGAEVNISETIIADYAYYSMSGGF